MEVGIHQVVEQGGHDQLTFSEGEVRREAFENAKRGAA
jgi:hypothetical protein